MGSVFYPNKHKLTIQNPNPCHTEGVARSISKSKSASRDISRSRAQYDKNSVITDNDSISVIASERSERGTSPQLRSGDLAHKREWAQLCKQNLYPQCAKHTFDKSNKIDCHDSTLRAESRNDDGRVDCYKSANADSRDDGNPYWVKYFTNSCNDKSTHPLAPSAREGEIKNDKATMEGIYNIKPTASSNNTNPQKYIKLAQIDSIRTDFVQIDFTKTAAESIQIDSTQTHSNQEYEQLQAKDLGKVTASAPKIQPRDNILDTESKNVIIIDKNDLQQKGYTNLEQALQHQPSITLTPAANGQSQIDIRGQGLDASKSIKIFINGVPINPNDTGYGASRNGFALNGTNPFNLVDINDIESIEVLPGGVAVLYGGGTRGGVVNIVTKKPSKDYARVSLEGIAYEAKNALSGKASVGGGAKIKDKVFLSANASYAYKNGLRPSEYTKNAYASLQTYYQINDKHRLDFNANYSKSYQFFAGYNNKFSTGTQEKSISQMKAERYATPTQATSNGMVEQDLGSASLKYIADFRESLQFSALAFYSFSDFLFPDIAGDPSSAGANITGTNSTHNTGLFAKIKHSTKSNKLFVGLDNNVEISQANSGSSDKRGGVRYSGALYVLDSFMPSKYFSLTGGARGEVVHYDVSRTAVTAFQGQPPSVTVQISTQTQKDTKANYAFELTPAFHYGESGSVYAKGEVGFISPSVAQIVNAVSQSTNTKELANANIKPEQYFTGEIGWRDEFRFSSIMMSAYYTHSFNEIRYIYQTAVRNFYNLGETQRFGFEFVGRQRLFGEILTLQESINVNYSNVLKGRDNTANFNNNSTAASDASQEGKQIPYVPLTKVSILANLQALKVGKHRLNVFYNNSYYGQSVDNNYAVMNKGGYVLGDIGLTYGYGGFSVSAGVRNLYDSFYVAYQASSNQSNTRTYLAGEGRNYYLTLKYEFCP